MKRMTIAISLLFVANGAVAGVGSSTGKVQSINVEQGAVFMFSAGTHNNKPACSTVGNDWAVSLATADGKAMYAMVLSAASQGQTVSVVGTNGCNVWPDRETPMYMWVNY